MLERAAEQVPFAWVAGDDEYGRPATFRAQLRLRGFTYVLDVPSNTQVRDEDEALAAGARRPPWRSVAEWALAQPASRWRRVQRGSGSKGPRVVQVLEGRVQTRDEG